MSDNQHRQTYDVIISGAGPVGLFLACELAMRKCSVLVLEKAESPHSPLKQLPFGLRGLNALSVEALYRRGLLEQLITPTSTGCHLWTEETMKGPLWIGLAKKAPDAFWLTHEKLLANIASAAGKPVDSGSAEAALQ